MISNLKSLKILPEIMKKNKTQPRKSKLKPKPHTINKYDTFCLPDKVLWLYMEEFERNRIKLQAGAKQIDILKLIDSP